MNTREKPILLIDFDGVLHSYASGWQGADIIPDAPVNGALDFIVDALQHFHVNIYSSRTGQDGGLPAMKYWCTEHFGEAITSQLFFPESKPAAFLTIDDRCFCFAGQWPQAKELLGFLPWNKHR